MHAGRRKSLGRSVCSEISVMVRFGSGTFSRTENRAFGPIYPERWFDRTGPYFTKYFHTERSSHKGMPIHNIRWRQVCELISGKK